MLPNLERKMLQNTSLSKVELAVILGGLLGTGNLKINPGYKNARYDFRHSKKQESYFMAKTEFLKGLAGAMSIQYLRPSGFSKQAKLCFCTKALQSLSIVHSVTYVKNQKRVQRRWLNHCTELSLAIWWFDDGSIIGKDRRGCFLTSKLCLKQQELLKTWLEKVWQISVKISPVKNNNSKGGKIKSNYRLYLSTSSLKTFLTYILPHVPTKDVLYKTIIVYKDKNLQQRWISHSKKYLPKKYWEDLDLLYEKMI